MPDFRLARVILSLPLARKTCGFEAVSFDLANFQAVSLISSTSSRLDLAGLRTAQGEEDAEDGETPLEGG